MQAYTFLITFLHVLLLLSQPRNAASPVYRANVVHTTAECRVVHTERLACTHSTAGSSSQSSLQNKSSGSTRNPSIRCGPHGVGFGSLRRSGIHVECTLSRGSWQRRWPCRAVTAQAVAMRHHVRRPCQTTAEQRRRHAQKHENNGEDIEHTEVATVRMNVFKSRGWGMIVHSQRNCT